MIIIIINIITQHLTRHVWAIRMTNRRREIQSTTVQIVVESNQSTVYCSIAYYFQNIHEISRVNFNSHTATNSLQTKT